MEKATFAGGCFWCMEPPYEKLDGTLEVTPGYMGGDKENPTYEEVCSGTTGHAEVVQIIFDPEKVTYEKLLDTFWVNIDPTTHEGQFADIGSQYRPAIFYHSGGQKRLAESSREDMQNSGRFDKPIVVEITKASTFYPAEEYHRNYHRKNPAHYKNYRRGSGRESYLARVWGN